VRQDYELPFADKFAGVGCDAGGFRVALILPTQNLLNDLQASGAKTAKKLHFDALISAGRLSCL
jgi:hypothetical protein